MPFSRTLATTALIIGLSGAPVLAQSASGEGEAEAANAETVVASVNGEDILLGDLIAIRAELPSQYQSIPDAVLYSGLLTQIIDQTLLRQAAERAGIDERASIRRGLEFQRTSFLAEFYTRERLNEQISEESLALEYKKRYVDAEERTQINASHILVETEEKAQEIAGLARAEGADFAALAKEHSTGPSAPRGGDLGFFGPGQMVPAFDAAVFALEVGEISEPIETQFGWHVIRLNADHPPLEQVREALIGEMTNEITQSIVAALRDAGDIAVPEDQPGLDQLRNDELIADE